MDYTKDLRHKTDQITDKRGRTTQRRKPTAQLDRGKPQRKHPAVITTYHNKPSTITIKQELHPKHIDIIDRIDQQ